MSLTFADLIMCIEDHANLEGLEPADVIRQLEEHFTPGSTDERKEVDSILREFGFDLDFVDLH